MKYLTLLMVIINILYLYRMEKLRKISMVNKEDKSLLNDFISVWKTLINFILFGLSIFLLSFTLKGAVNININKVYNIIVIIYVVLNLFSLLGLINKFKKIIK